MKLIAVYLFTTILLSSCHHTSRENITKLFEPVYKAPARVSAKSYHIPYGFCDWDIAINSDSTFTWRRGCEGESASVVGRWHLVADSIELVQYPKNPANVAYFVSFSQLSSDSRVTIVVTDKTGAPVQNLVVLPFNKRPGFTFTDSGVKLGNKEYTGNFPYGFATDSTGTITLPKAEKDSLAFLKLGVLTGKRFRMSTDNLPDTIRLVTSINAIAFKQSQVKYGDGDNKPVKFAYKNGALIAGKK
jgi:hypothetical protein